jgi:hypothetical protein
MSSDAKKIFLDRGDSSPLSFIRKLPLVALTKLAASVTPE